MRIIAVVTPGTAATVSLAFVLGLRHGLDADHLAAIDGLTRCGLGAKRRFAPFCGVLFSAGHAGVIVPAAVVLALVAGHWEPPEWLGPLGLTISIGMLLLLGFMNLHAALSTRSDVRPSGVRSKWLAPLLHARRWWQVSLVGVLFAVSFDALAIAVLFASSASEAFSVVGLALAFAVGMLTVGAANGFWVVRLLRHSGDSSRIASRVMTLTIGVVALCASACVLLPETYELIVSGLVVTVVLLGYFTSLYLAHRARIAGAPSCAA